MLKLRVLDTGGDILGETGLLNPGEYVKTSNADKNTCRRREFETENHGI